MKLMSRKMPAKNPEQDESISQFLYLHSTHPVESDAGLTRVDDTQTPPDSGCHHDAKDELPQPGEEREAELAADGHPKVASRIASAYCSDGKRNEASVSASLESCGGSPS